jgi:hypothetical protein
MSSAASTASRPSSARGGSRRVQGPPLGFEETVAVKCLKLKPKLSEAAHDEFLKRFLAEGKLLHQLSRATADVVQALDVGVARSPNGTETPYLVLEWLEARRSIASFARAPRRANAR